MSNCNTFITVPQQCKDNIGGYKKIWIGAFEGFTFTLSGQTGDAIGMVTAIQTGVTDLYEMTPARFSSIAGEVQAIDNTNSVWKQTVTSIFVKNEARKRNLMLSLGQSICISIVKDSNGKYFLYGSDNGLQQGTTQTTGTVAADKNIWTVTLEGDERYPALEVSASVMASYDL